jgi:hypothetical protein
MEVGCAVLYTIFGHDVQEAQVCRQDLNNEQDLQEAQMYWRHGCTGGTVIGGTCLQDTDVQGAKMHRRQMCQIQDA